MTRSKAPQSSAPLKLTSRGVAVVLCVILLAVSTAALVGLIVFGDPIWNQSAPNNPEPVTPTQPVLQEDDPGWDCATMGNKTCGSPELIP